MKKWPEMTKEEKEKRLKEAAKKFAEDFTDVFEELSKE